MIVFSFLVCLVIRWIKWDLSSWEIGEMLWEYFCRRSSSRFRGFGIGEFVGRVIELV